MRIPHNPSDQILSVRRDDRVRIESRIHGGAFVDVAIDLRPRQSDLHCLVSLPALPNEFIGRGGNIRVWFTAAYEEEGDLARPFVLFLVPFRRGRPRLEARMRFVAGPSEHRMCLAAGIPDEADQYQLVFYADRRYSGVLTVSDLLITSGTDEYRIAAGHHDISTIDLRRRWQQVGRLASCSSPYGNHSVEMPEGWDLEAVHPARLAAADWLLYSQIDRATFGQNTPVDGVVSDQASTPGSAVLFGHSDSPESVAGLSVLPDDSRAYFCDRSFTAYRLSTGVEATGPPLAGVGERIAKIPRVTVLRNDFELAQVAAGGRVGFAHGFAQAAFGLLLADGIAAGTVALGAGLEQVFLQSGNQFVDVVAVRSSMYNGTRRLLESAGLAFALPMAACSEVLADRICELTGRIDWSMACASPTSDGQECGRCVRCFRIGRRIASGVPLEPGQAVLRHLQSRPLKGATRLVYAAQKLGFRHADLDEYADVDLEYLERSFDYALETVIPPSLQSHVHRRLRSFGIAPMSDDDELRLRTIGQIFAPEQFSWTRAGIAEPESYS